MASTSGSSTGGAANVTQPDDYENLFFEDDTLAGADTNTRQHYLQHLH
jgi:hypothetical protein